MAVKKHFLFFVSAFLVFVLDQAVKWFVSAHTVNRDFSFVKIHFVKNMGVGFGVLNQSSIPFLRWILVGIISVIIIGILYYYSRHCQKSKSLFFVFALGLVLGGAMGNLLDRVLYGFVIDFIDVGFWPAFNIADSAITIGIILLIVYSWITPTLSSINKNDFRKSSRKKRNI